MLTLSSLLYERVLVCFNLQFTDRIEIPVPLDFPILEVENDTFKSRKPVLEKNDLNVEFLYDLLKDGGFFLQRGICQIYKSPKPHSVVSFQFGDKEKRVRKALMVRRTMVDFLGQAVWNVQIYEDFSNSEMSSLIINLSSQKPYFSQAGEVLDVRPDFILQSQNGGLIFEPTNMKQNSAA
jgi:hypothetical protein